MTLLLLGQDQGRVKHRALPCSRADLGQERGSPRQARCLHTAFRGGSVRSMRVGRFNGDRVRPRGTRSPVTMCRGLRAKFSPGCA